jgi:hypothetical protein
MAAGHDKRHQADTWSRITPKIAMIFIRSAHIKRIVYPCPYGTFVLLIEKPCFIVGASTAIGPDFVSAPSFKDKLLGFNRKWVKTPI